MNAREIVSVWLRKHGYDGLCNSDAECGCSADDLAPCGEIQTTCEPAFLCTLPADRRCEGCTRDPEAGRWFCPRNPATAGSQGAMGRILDAGYALVVIPDADEDTRFCAIDVRSDLVTDVVGATGLQRFASVNDNPLAALAKDVEAEAAQADEPGD